MNRRSQRTGAASNQSGLSLVELMVGITVGLFVVAAASTLVANQLSNNRRLLLETQVQQDLRSSMDIITRQLRRAGAGTANNVEAGIAAAPAAGGASSPFGVIAPLSAAGTETQFTYYFDASQQGPYGFKLENNIVKSKMQAAIGGSYQWQELTDPNTLKVTRFSITPRTVSSTPLPCPKLCSDGTTDCWPRLLVRSFVVEIEGEAKSDPAVRRALRNDVRVRNDAIETPTNPVCPP